MKSVRLFVIHSDEIVREGLRHILGGYQDIEIVGEAAVMERALVQVAGLAPDVLIMEGRNTGPSLEVAPEFTISVSRDLEGRPLVNVTAYKERQLPGEVVVIGRQSEHRVQVTDVGPQGCRITESKREELAYAVELAAQDNMSPVVASLIASPTLAEGSWQLPGLMGPDGRNGESKLQRLSGPTPDTSSENLVHAETNGHGIVAHANGKANGTGNGAMASGDGQPKRRATDWFGPVLNRDVDSPPDGVTENGVADHSEGSPGGQRETTEEATGPMDLTDMHETEVVEELDDVWLHTWKEPIRDEEARKDPGIEVELVFPSCVRVAELYTFIRRLRQATKAEIKETVGSSKGTSVKVTLHWSVPLLQILHGMPEVAEAKPEPPFQIGQDTASPASPLPKQVYLTLKIYEEPKQLSLMFDAPPLG